MKGYINWMDKNPKWLKVVLALFLGIFWTIYRIFKSATKKNVVGVIFGVILLFVGVFFIWIVDIITLIFSDKILWID